MRLGQIEKHWLSTGMQREERFALDRPALSALLENMRAKLEHCRNSNEVLAREAEMTKALYKLAVNAARYDEEFTRAKHGSGTDSANRFLDHGNYLAYGLAATATWVLGLPHGLAVLHGKTRRGGLVFDVADLVKDALILPTAFIAAMAGDDEQEFRRRCMDNFNRGEALDVMIDGIKDVAMQMSKIGQGSKDGP